MVQWNCRSITTTLDYIVQYISTNNFDLLSLQSLNCQPQKLPHLEGYHHPPVCGPTSPDGRVMVCIYVRLHMNFSIVADTAGPANGYTCAVRVRVKGNPDVTIVNCYTPTPCTSFEWLSGLGGKGGCVVMGDFNVRDRCWERGWESSSPALTSQINDSCFVILNDGSSTRIPDRSDQRPSAIDLTFASADLAGGVGWEVGVDTLSSDHLPITISMTHAADIGSSAPVTRFRYESADWDLFRAELRSVDIDVDQPDLENVNSRIVSSLLEAARVAIPTTSGGTARPGSNPWWNEDCEEAVRTKRKLYKIYWRNQTAETHAEMKLANRNCNKVTARAKRDYWLAFSDSVSAGKTDLGSVWKKIKKMKQQYVAPNFDLHKDNRVYTTDQAKADAFAEAFAEASNTENLPADRRQSRREREAVYSDPAADDSLPVNSPLTCTELKRALASIKKVKVSTGLDIVSYQMLMEVPESFLKTLLGFFQRCWDGGTIPAEWKHAVVVPIHKIGKARKEIASYRPISLTSHLGKVYERVIKRRLEYFCESKKVFPACQAGFRRGRGVTDHLVKLGEHVGRAMGKRKVLLSCFFDISRAYDQVWHARLLQKLQKIGLSGKIYNYIKTFLTGRSLQVRWKGAMSAAKQIDMGVPQGSVIAPLLFNIMVHDVESCVQGKVVLTMYADDLAIWLDTHVRRPHKENNRNMAISMKTFQEAVDGVIRFMQVNGFTLSTQKTVFLPFHICSRRIQDISIKVNNEHVFPTDQVKYLGVVFQRMGRTNRHVDHNARNASRALNVIKVLSTQPWANPPKVLVSLVRSLVRSRLVYGLEAMPSITETGLKRLTAIEVRALRLALGLPQSAPHSLVYRDAGLLPLRDQIQLMTAKYVFRSQTVDNSTVEEVSGSFRGPTRVSYCSSICDLVADLVEGAGLDGASAADRPLHPYPPWLMERAVVEVEVAGLTRDQSPSLQACITNELLENNYSQFLQIFTDGSVLEDGSAGAAFAIPEFHSLRKSFSLPPVSIFTAELTAILMALQHISEVRTPPCAVVICSDSRSALSSIRSDSTSAREDLVLEIGAVVHQLITRGTEVRFQWVPAHVCLSGNEMADRAAKRGARRLESQTLQLKLGLADIYSKLSRRVWRKREEDFRAQATAKEWLDPYPPSRDGVFFPGVPTYLARIMYRLRMDCWRTMFVPKSCLCGGVISFHHVLFNCRESSAHFAPVTSSLTSLGLPLCVRSLALRHRQSWSLLRAAAKLVYSCPVAAYL